MFSLQKTLSILTVANFIKIVHSKKTGKLSLQPDGIYIYILFYFTTKAIILK